MLDRAPFVKLALGVKVGGVSKLGCVEETDVTIPSFDHDHRLPPAAVRCHAKNSAGFVVGACHALILRVNGSRNVAQVRKRVVGTDSVDMVDLTGRPRPMDMEPSEAMRPVKAAVDPYLSIAIAVKAASHGASGRPTSALNSPYENASLLRVVNKFAQTLRGKIGLSHDAVLSLIGQRLGSVEALAGLRHFNAKGVA